MENKILMDPAVRPDDEVLEDALGNNYQLFKKFGEKTSAKSLVLEWNYYRDGKSWLCKVLNKKKNLCWLSVWDTGFKLTFYFTQKTINGVCELEINDNIKKMAQETKPSGKLLPIMLSIKNKKIINDAIKLLEYKMALK